jgi:hypothetical protein
VKQNSHDEEKILRSESWAKNTRSMQFRIFYSHNSARLAVVRAVAEKLLAVKGAQYTH